MSGTPERGTAPRDADRPAAASVQRYRWWTALNRRIRAEAYDDLGNTIERHLLHPTADPLPIRRDPARRARVLAARADRVDNLRNLVRRYLDPGADTTDEATESELVDELADLIEWSFWPRDEYGTCDGLSADDVTQVQRRGDHVHVTGYVSVMYFDIPDKRWDDDPQTLLMGHWKDYVERPFSAQLRNEGQSVVRLAAASEEVHLALCARLAPAIVADFVGPYAREIWF